MGQVMNANDVNITDDRYLIFKVAGDLYGVNISSVAEIRAWEAPSSLPLAEPYVKGVISMRGEIVPVIDLRLRFGLPEVSPDSETSIILLQTSEAKSRVVGAIVDEVSDIHQIKKDTIEKNFELSKRKNCDYFSGITTVKDSLVILINQNYLLGI